MSDTGGEPVRYDLDWNGPVDRPFEIFADADKASPVSALFERIVARHPDRLAVHAAGEGLTYGEVGRQVRRLASHLAAETDADDLVGLYLPVSSEFAIAVLACFSAGRIFVPLDVHYPKTWIEEVVADSAPALVVVRSAGDAVALDLAGRRTLGLSTLENAGVDDAPRPAGPDEPACVLYTSGSSGRPKGIVNSQRNLLQRVAQSINAAHFNVEDRFLSLASLCTVVGVRDLLTAWLCGASVHLVDAQTIGARELIGLIREENITVVFAFPALLRLLTDLTPGGAGEALRLVRVGGDTLLWGDVDRLRAWLPAHADIQLIYAATEAPMTQWFVSDAMRDGGERVPIGFPLPGNEISIVDDIDAPTPAGEIGELVAHSRYVALGYWIGGACRPGSIAADPVERGVRIFRTGDLALKRADGLLELAGRKDRQVKVSGMRVEPEGVEALLREIPGVREAAVVARKFGAAGPVRLIGYLAAQPDAPPDLLDRAAALLHERAPPHMQPRTFHLVDAIPRLPNSKPDLRALQALDARRGEETPPRTPRDLAKAPDEIVRIAADAWEAVLGRPPGAEDEDFFEAGGDSLMALNLVFALESALSIEIEVTLLNEAPAFGRLCEALASHRPTVGRRLVLLKAGDRTGSVFMVPSVGGNAMELALLARRMTWQGLVWALPARGLDGRAEPYTTVEAMAEDHLQAIQARQPEGPYYLCGYSFGGLVAFEIARRLRAADEDVAFLGMFDTVPNIRRWPLQTWLSYVALRIARRGAALATMPVREWGGYVGGQAARAWRHLAWRWRSAGGESPLSPATPEEAPAHYGTVMLEAIQASATYRLESYPGTLTLFRPATRDPDFARSESLWRRYVRELQAHALPGTHGSLLREPHVTAAAALLSDCLRASLPPPPDGLSVR